MTQEEKARAYDEALKDMRVIYPNLRGDAKLAVEHAFPQLAESEDERMINELQGFLDSFGADYFGTGEWQKFHDWLEKQKETGIRWFKSDNVKNPDKPYIDKAGMFYTTDGRMCYASEIEKQKGETLRDFIDDFPYRVEQKEQKPYEPKNWPADKDNLTQEQKPVKYGDDIVEEAEEYTSKVDCGEYGVEVTEAYIAGVLSERNRGTEWSAKGRRGRIGTTPEHIRKKAENFLSKMEPPYDADDICSAYETGAMENANPSWSEEDDQLIGFIFDLLNDLVWRKDWAMSKEECLERLKSLRPQSQWKPEGQQLDCLRHMINVSTVGKIDKQLVQDLYEQLKTLM